MAEQNSTDTCAGRRKTGQPCNARPTRSGYCFAHDPQLKQKRDTARRHGGSNSSRQARLANRSPSPFLSEVQSQLLSATRDVTNGRLDARSGQALASLATAALRSFETASLEDRIRRLEEVGDGHI